MCTSEIMSQTFKPHSTQYGCTALFLASQSGHEEVVKVLLLHGADAKICDQVYIIPLCMKIISSAYIVSYTCRKKAMVIVCAPSLVHYRKETELWMQPK